MKPRVLLVVAFGWLIAYAGLYAAIMMSQDSEPAGWYLGLLMIGAALIGVDMVVEMHRWCLLSAMGVLSVAALLGLLTIGILLVPAIALVGAAVARLDSAASPAPNQG